MMGKAEDLTGRRYGRWTVLARAGRRTDGGNNRYYWARCDCGNVKRKRGDELSSGASKQCWDCKESPNASNKTIHHQRAIEQIMRRKDACVNPNNKQYHMYGAKGISVHPDWAASSKNFVDWAMDHGWHAGATLKRHDNTKDFTPDNCYIVSLHPDPQPKRKLSQEDFEFIRQNCKYMSPEEIGYFIGMSPKLVNQHIKTHRLRKRKFKWFPEEVEMLRDLSTHMSIRQMMPILDKTYQSIRNKLHTTGINLNIPLAKYGLTFEQFKTIHDRHVRGERLETIALDMKLPISDVLPAYAQLHTDRFRAIKRRLIK